MCLCGLLRNCFLPSIFIAVVCCFKTSLLTARSIVSTSAHTAEAFRCLDSVQCEQFIITTCEELPGHEPTLNPFVPQSQQCRAPMRSQELLWKSESLHLINSRCPPSVAGEARIIPSWVFVIQMYSTPVRHLFCNLGLHDFAMCRLPAAPRGSRFGSLELPLGRAHRSQVSPIGGGMLLRAVTSLACGQRGGAAGGEKPWTHSDGKNRSHQER